MALQFIDGFDSVDVSGSSGTAFENHLKLKYNNVDVNYSTTSSVLVTGRFGGTALHWLKDYSGLWLDVAISGSPSELVIGFAYRTPTYQGGNDIVTLRNASAQEISELSIDYHGYLYVNRSTTSIARASKPLKPETWYYIEWKIKPDNSAGATEVRVNGVSVCSATGVDTEYYAAPVTHVRFQAQDPNSYLDDIYICDTTGSVNNNFLGPCMVESLLPSADTTDADFDTSTGTDHYALVDEVPCDYETSYVESDTTGNKDIWDYENLSDIDGSVFGVYVWTYACATTGSFDLKTVADDGTTEDTDGGTTVDSTSYVGSLRMLDQTPSSNSWTVTRVNGSSFGVEVDNGPY